MAWTLTLPWTFSKVLQLIYEIRKTKKLSLYMELDMVLAYFITNIVYAKGGHSFPISHTLCSVLAPPKKLIPEMCVQQVL